MHSVNDENITLRDYREIRSSLKTGDLAMFPRLTRRDVENAPPGEQEATKLGWCSNLGIAISQLSTNLTLWWDHLWEFPHVGMVYRDRDNNEVLLLESLSRKDKHGKTGPRLARFRCRVCQYPKQLLVIPTRFAATQAGLAKLEVKLKGIRQHEYDYVGLIDALTGLGIESKSAEFCSELVVKVWLLLGLVPSTRIVALFPDQKLRVKRQKLRPSRIKPSQCGRMHGVVDVGRAMLVRGNDLDILAYRDQDCEVSH